MVKWASAPSQPSGPTEPQSRTDWVQATMLSSFQDRAAVLLAAVTFSVLSCCPGSVTAITNSHDHLPASQLPLQQHFTQLQVKFISLSHILNLSNDDLSYLGVQQILYLTQQVFTIQFCL